MARSKQYVPPFSLSGIYVPPGVTPKFSKHEQNPQTFDPNTSLLLPPLGVDPNGKPYYHLPGDGSNMDPYDSGNHARLAFRKYYDAKLAAKNTTGTLPAMVWYLIGAGALGLGVIFALRK